MALDVRTAQNTLEDLLHDVILYALGHRLPAVADTTALRSVMTQGATSTVRSDDDLINIVVAGVVVAAYRWNTTSTATDDGDQVIQPNDVTGAGRWLAWTSGVRFAPTVGGNSYYLHELLDGPLNKVFVLDKSLPEEEISALIIGQVPAVVIEASSDEPSDMGQHVGWRYDTTFEFKLTTISENLRSQRQATHGSAIDSDAGANAIDGWLQSLVGGVNLFPAQSGIRTVQLGRGDNYISDLGQRRVHRERPISMLCTVENPPALNDTGLEEEFTLQAEMTDLHDQPEADLDNYVVSGIEVLVDSGLTQMVTVGSAYIGGTLVSFAGTPHTFPANSDIYRDLNPNGTLTFVAVSTGESPPGLTPGALRIGVSQTDSSSVVSDRYIAITKKPFEAQFEIPL
jgi:hypothetical protein